MDPEQSNENWKKDRALPRGEVPGTEEGKKGAVVFDIPGVLVKKDAPLPAKKTTEVQIFDFQLFLKCGDDQVAVVEWGFTQTMVEDERTRTVTFDPKPPKIICPDEKGFEGRLGQLRGAK